MLAIIYYIYKMDQEIDNHSMFLGLKICDKYSDMMSISSSFVAKGDKNNKTDNSGLELINRDVSQDKIKEYFNLLFSPKNVADSLIRHNQLLQIKCLQDSESEPEQLYNRRAKRVKNLQQKQTKNLHILADLKRKDGNKYETLSVFLKLFGSVKEKIGDTRHDYYSQKSFLALKKLTSEQLDKVTKIFHRILMSAISESNKSSFSQKKLQELYLQFLTIPRFFISKQKLLKLIVNESIEQNFKMLIQNGCLGHYNNQANKRLPQQNQMKYVRELLSYPDGKQRFKKICTINHGGKFFKVHGELYYNLYYKSLQCLKKISQICKKSYSNERLMEELQKQDQKDINQAQDIKTVENQDFKLDKLIQNDIHERRLMIPLQFCEMKSVSSFPNFLPNLDEEAKLTKSTSTMVHSTNLLENELSKTKVKRVYSLMPTNQANKQISSKLKVKKSYTLQTGRQFQKGPNIFIVPPPGLHRIEGQLSDEDV